MSVLDELQHLHDARIERAKMQDQLDAAYTALRATPQYAAAQEIEDRLTYQDALLKQIRFIIVTEVLEEYNTLPEYSKHPFPGVDIRVSQKVHYGQELAKSWCLDNLASALVIDHKVFSDIILRIARSNKAGVPRFVEIKDEPSVTIATDLAKHLSREEPPRETPATGV